MQLIFFSEELSNTLRVLVATDCHLGYMEKDEIRRHDSFQAFEEICSIAEQKEVRANFSVDMYLEVIMVYYICFPATFWQTCQFQNVYNYKC